ncbi:MAG: hypothetical protein HGA44_22470, partial [Cellulomonadaceae bacterium]|nr:hypothetical protein [Cellulomonadaceae bacterium]
GTATALVYENAVQEALCFGWIDGQTGARDAETMRIRMTPRRARSRWSASNVARVGRLGAEGKIEPAGLVQIEAAKADGRWDAAYGGTSTIEMPDDLAAALAADPAAQAWWGVLTSTNRFSIIYRVTDAKRPETRARRIATYVADLAKGQTPYPQRAKP